MTPNKKQSTNIVELNSTIIVEYVDCISVNRILYVYIYEDKLSKYKHLNGDSFIE